MSKPDRGLWPRHSSSESRERRTCTCYKTGLKLKLVGWPAVLSSAQTVPGVTQQVCSTPNNPYAILPITQSQGTLKAGCNLVSSWNDIANNTPGRGNIIW